MTSQTDDTPSRVISSDDNAKHLVKLAEERARDPKWVWGMSWGPDFPALDRMTHGIDAKKMVLLISRPAAGKSALAAKWALNVARSFKGTGKVVRVVTLEMSAASWQMRIGSFIAQVPIYRIESGYATAEQRARFVAAQAELAQLPIEYLESAESIEEIERFIGADRRCGFWVLDHIGIVPGISTAFSTYQAIQKVSQRVTKLCHLRVTGLILGHQNRQGTQGDDKRPTQDSVAGADQIARDADLILGLYRPDMFVRVADDEVKVVKAGELLVLKNRNGPMGTIHTLYHSSRTDWVEDQKANKTVGEEEREEAGGGLRPTP